jgi:Na+/serine symporter
VLVFAAIFGAGMVATERSSGHSVFGALRHIQEVCILIFDWFNLLVPVGIVALIAPQVARLGPDVYAVLAVFAVALLATSLLIFAAIIGLICLTLRVGPLTATANILGPLLLAAATSNTLICIPLALDTMKDKFRIDRQLCDLYIPLGFATMRFGSIVRTLRIGSTRKWVNRSWRRSRDYGVSNVLEEKECTMFVWTGLTLLILGVIVWFFGNRLWLMAAGAGAALRHGSGADRL